MKTLKWFSAVGLLILWLAASTPASAHANLIRSEPAPNSTNSVPPSVVRLWFSESVEPTLCNIRVLDRTGNLLDKQDTHGLPGEATGLAVSLPNLAEGLYTVSWKVTSAIDGHVTSGSFGFGVGAVAPESSEREIISLVDAALANEASPPFYQVLVRWVTLLLLVLIAGAILFPLLVLFPSIRMMLKGQPQRNAVTGYLSSLLSNGPLGDDTALNAWSSRWVSVTRLLSVLLGAWTVVALFSQAYATSGDMKTAGAILTSTRYGIIWLVRAVLVVAIGLVFFRSDWNWGAHSASFRRLLIAAVLSLGLVATQSLSSHNAAVANPPALPPLADYIHLLGVSIWVGGLAQLLLASASYVNTLPESQRRAALANLVACFSIVAFTMVGAITLTGAYSMLLQVGSLAAFANTLYGATLFVKFLIILPLLLLGGLNLLIARPSIGSSRPTVFLKRFGLAVAAELALASGVLLAVGVLTSVPPAAAAYDPNTPLWLQTRRINDPTAPPPIIVTLGIKPGLAGTNDFDVVLHDDSGNPIPDALVVRALVHMREMDMGVQQVNTTNQGEGHYTFRGDLLSMVGTWQIEVLVRRSGVSDVRAPFSLVTLGQRLPPTAPPLLLTSSVAQAGLGFTLFALLIGSAAVLLVPWERQRRIALGGALLISLIGVLVISEVQPTGATSNTIVLPAVPEFARLQRNPVAPVPIQIAAGELIYQENCSACHGASGKGDGPAAANLSPKPADLTVHVPQHTDGELFWWITHGIATTAMPAWEGTLTEVQRWQVVTFLRRNLGTPANTKPLLVLRSSSAK